MFGFAVLTLDLHSPTRTSISVHLYGVLTFAFQDGVFDENNEKAFYDSDSEEKKDRTEAKPYVMDPDHRLLLRNTKPLLQSRNTAVSLSSDTSRSSDVKLMENN